MAESIVSSAVQWIGSLLIQEGAALLDVKEKVESLKQDLVHIKAYLQDADSKQHQEEIGVLITQIRKLAYDAEDVIENYIVDVEARVWNQRKRGRLLRYACFLYKTPTIYEVVKNIQTIQSSLNQVESKFHIFRVNKHYESGTGGGGSGPSQDDINWGQKRVRQSYSHYDDADDSVVGWEKDIAKLLKVLVDEEKSQMCYLSIVGMGGSGKTTLARNLYNNLHIRKHFNCKAWVSISQEWSIWEILSQIFRKVGESRQVVHASVEELRDDLRELLEKKSYLVVLDDVWSSQALQKILPALPRGNINRGSKIVITTRNQEIVKPLFQMQHIYEPPPLNNEEAWDLFSKSAFSGLSDNCYKESFENLARVMIRKCNGLPLAIVALSGILRTKTNITQWQEVNEAVRLKVMEGTATNKYDTVGDLLALSYDDLPYYLKPCFLYLATFPEDCQIPTGMLTRMWIAEGLVVEQYRMSPEDVAIQYLEQLNHRFMIQIARTNFKGEIKAIRMHDLLRDLCVKKAKEQSFLEVYTPKNCPPSSDMPQFLTELRPRRAALHSSVTLPTRVSHLRSLIMLTRSSVSSSAYTSKQTLHFELVYKNFRLLRLLNLWGVMTSDGTLPPQIGSLVHLRYLGIRASNVMELPASIGNLRNLLTLDYRGIDSDIDQRPVKIPDSLGKLVLLRHLFLPIECPWSVGDLSLSEMKNLRTLWGVKRGESGDWLSREMETLSTTLKKLKIVVSTQKELATAFCCPCILSDGLRTFHCEMTDGVSMQLLGLSDRQHLHKLILIGEIRKQLDHILPSNLVMLELKDSKLKDEDPMGAIGALQHLKFLRLSDSYLGNKFTCKSGSFPQLEELYLANLANLNEWIVEKGSMVCLKKLEILRCKLLMCFPKGLLFVKNLGEVEYFGVPKEFAQQASELGWAPKYRLPHYFDSIIEQSDSLLDTFSMKKLYEQLTAGIFLNQKQQKYWILKQGDSYYNCFMLYAMDLFPLPLDDMWLQTTSSLAPYELYQPMNLAESDGTLIEVKQVEAPLKLHGKFDTRNLSSGVTYEMAFVIMLPQAACASPISACVCEVSFAIPSYDRPSERHEHSLDDKPRDEWIRLLAGTLKVTEFTGKLVISLIGLQPGAVIKGVTIEPVL